MRKLMAIVVGLILLAGVAAAQSIYTPQRGTELRSTLMDTMRPYAEEVFGAPVEFVVNDLKVKGDHAYASVTAQRPGGIPIDLHKIPAQDMVVFGINDYTGMNFFLRVVNGRWTVYAQAAFATDVWWEGRADICPEWGPLLEWGCKG